MSATTAEVVWSWGGLAVMNDGMLCDANDLTKQLGAEALASLDMVGIILHMTPALQRQGNMLNRLRNALPEHEREQGLYWERAVLTAIDTHREVLAAVDAHVQGWHPGRNPADVVAHLTDEINLLRDAERGAQDVAAEALAAQRKAEVERDDLKGRLATEEAERIRCRDGWAEAVRINDAALAECDDLKARLAAAEEKAETYRKQCEADWNACCDVLTWARAFGKDLPPPSRAVAAVCERVLELELTPDADPYVSRVTEFHRAMGLPVRVAPSVGTVEERILRVRLLLEEALEYATASAVRVLVHVGHGGVLHGASDLEFEPHDVDQPDLVAMTHELGDCQVIVSGCAVQLGLPLLAAVSEEIHPANMRKLGPDGRPVVRGDGKVVKPEGWKPANVARIVERVLAAGEVSRG